MTRRPLALLILSAALTVPSAVFSSARPTMLARVVAVRGEATWRSPLADREWFRRDHGGVEWVPVEVDDRYDPELKLRTGKNGKVALDLADGGKLALQANGEIELRSLRDSAQEGETRIRLTRDMIEASAISSAAGAFIVETNAGTILVPADPVCVRAADAQPSGAPCGAAR